jgi:DNA replication protein DnaC
MSVPTVTPELKALLRRVKLGRCLDTLPERLSLAATGQMGHAEFLEVVLADEVTRRETTSADRRARAAGLDPEMTLDRWDDTAKITYDRAVWNELCSLRFVEAGHNAVIMGPVGVGKTFLATALGHAAVRRRFTVHFERCDRLLKRLRACRLDNRGRVRGVGAHGAAGGGGGEGELSGRQRAELVVRRGNDSDVI